MAKTDRGARGMTVEDLLDDSDERQDDGSAISEALARLSNADVTPSEVTSTAPFEAEDVRPGAAGIMTALLKVQGWLRLADDVDPRAELPKQLEQLFDRMGVPSVASCIDLDGPEPSITDVGLQELRDRLDKSVSLKDKFTEDLEAGGSVEAASAGWIDAWEEPDDRTIDGDIIAKTEIWPIQDFAAKAKSGRLELSPPYQRSDVWPTNDAQRLIESILRGIPLPSVIILRPDKDGEAPYEVVDGKQRLTSILRFIGAHPRALALVDEMDQLHPEFRLAEQFHKNYPAFRRAWVQATGQPLSAAQERANYFPFKISASAELTGDLAQLRGKYYSQIKPVKVRIGGERIPVSDVFEAACDYKIPLITYTEATPQQIHQVFSLYNRQGKHLNAEELRNAVYHDVKLMRALSVTAGDVTSSLGVADDIEIGAPFLTPVKGAVRAIQAALSDYNFGEARYRRTKVLSWLSAMLFVESLNPDGSPRLRSTAAQINEGLLDRIKLDKRDPLASEATIRAAVDLWALGTEAHAAITEPWSPKFKDGRTGERWQELQLVASLLGVTMAGAVLVGDTIDRLEDSAAEIRSYAERKYTDGGYQRPAKTQTKVQWEYIARVALGIVDIMGVDPVEVDTRLKEVFGASSVTALQRLRGGF